MKYIKLSRNKTMFVGVRRRRLGHADITGDFITWIYPFAAGKSYSDKRWKAFEKALLATLTS
jgi:hypothetical protein